MAKPKAQTLQQRFGFMDEDLKKPKHDVIMFWLDDCVDEKLADWLAIPKDWTEEEVVELRQRAALVRENRIRQAEKELEERKSWFIRLKSFPGIEPIFPQVAERGEETFEEQSKQIIQSEQQLEQVSRGIQESPVPPKPFIRIVKKQWEHPILSRDYTIGFIDMMVIYEQPFLSIELELTDAGWVEQWHVTFYRYSHNEENSIYFEAKTEIPSLGELIRQINMYRSYGAKRFFVVSPNDSYAQLLKRQGIGLILFA